MSNVGKTALVPKLRFPEFQGADEWALKCVEDYFNVGSSKRVLQQDWTTHGIPFYRTRELVSLSKGEPFASEIFISDKLFSEITERYGAPKEGDFLVSGVGTLGISYLVRSKDKFYFKDGNVLWFEKKGAISSAYFKYCFESDLIQHQIVKQASVSTVGTYTIQNAKTTKLFVPPTAIEQQKIADCLSSLDELIAAQARKVDALKTHKKGLMQQLFPHEGETQPRLRFPEFRGVGKWEVGPLSQFAQINPRREVRPDDVEVSFVPMNAVSESGYLASPQARNYGLVKKGFTAFRDNDVILAKITPCFENGKAALVTELVNGIGFGSTEFHVVRANNSCLPAFIFAQIYSDQFRYLGKASMTGSGGQQRVPTAFVENYLLSVPSLAEQQRIADCLTSLDTLITAATQELETLKTHKKGLMQQLFPTAEALEA